MEKCSNYLAWDLNEEGPEVSHLNNFISKGSHIKHYSALNVSCVFVCLTEGCSSVLGEPTL